MACGTVVGRTECYLIRVLGRRSLSRAWRGARIVVVLGMPQDFVGACIEIFW